MVSTLSSGEVSFVCKRNSKMSLGTVPYGTVVLECSQLKLSHSQNITLEERPEKDS